MLINGEKFACEACIRGHRVSSCHHQDRPLVHVNKKGRPVSQCHHCRGLRKARSQHVKCECHDKAHSKEECPHENGDDPNTCCCAHGARCTCALKKEHLDPVLEDIPQLIQPKESPRPKINNMNSHESKATVFTNGHHKPVHKFNDAHNHCGTPYKVPSRSHTIHGHREIAQRSTDSLPSTKTSKPFHESPLHNSITSATDQLRMAKSEHNSPLLGPTAMPNVDLPADYSIPTFDPNAYSYSPFGSDSPATAQTSQPDLSLPERFPDSWFMTYEQAHEYEPPIPSAGMPESQPIDWGNFNPDMASNFYDTGMTNNDFSTLQTAIPNFEQFNQLRNSALAPSSGEISETEDMTQTSRPLNLRTVSGDASNDFSSTGDDDTPEKYRLSSASSYYGTPQANILANENLTNLDIDEYMRQTEEQTRKMQLHQQQQQQQQQQFQIQQRQQQQQQQQQNQILKPTSSPQIPNSGPGFPSPNSNTINLGEHPFTVHEAQQYAHMNDALQRMKTIQQIQQQKSPTPTDLSSNNIMIGDPTLSTAPDMSNPTLSLDDEQEDEDWVR